MFELNICWQERDITNLNWTTLAELNDYSGAEGHFALCLHQNVFSLIYNTIRSI